MNVLKPYGTLVAGLQRAVDSLIIVIAAYGANLALDHEHGALNAIAALSAVGCFLIGGEMRRLYNSWRLSSLDEEFMSVLLIWGGACCALIIGAFLAKASSSYSRLEMIAWFLITPAFLISSRLAIRVLLWKLRAAGKNIRTVAVAGAGPSASTIIKRLE